ncbi:MAG: holin [Actinophytocola sp.]|uniref:holin n=1 Tax=Actinophytocola sp. TaxID=1872138 RepID=UPI003D6BFFEE
MWTARFWKQTAERAVKTAAQVLLLLWASDGVFNILTVDPTTAAGVAAGGAVLSVLTSLVSLPVGPKGSPSMVSGVGGVVVGRLEVSAPAGFKPSTKAIEDEIRRGGGQ